MEPYRRPGITDTPGAGTPPFPQQRVASEPFRRPAPGTEQRPETHGAPPPHRHPRAPGPWPPADPPTVPTLVPPQPTPAAPPPEVRAAFWLWLGAAMLGVIVAVATLLNTRALVEKELRAAGGDPLTARLFDSILTRTVVVVVIVGVAGVLLHVTFAVLVRRGHGWARVVLTVVGATAITVDAYRVSTASTVQLRVGAVDTVDPVTLMSTALQALVLLVAVVLFFRPRANYWFRTESVRREVGRARRAADAARRQLITGS